MNSNCKALNFCGGSGRAMEMEMELPVATVTQHDQWKVESQVFRIYDLFGNLPPNAQSVM